MKKTEKIIPSFYTQPVEDFPERILEEDLEKVTYLEQSSLRFWYNNQTENYSSHWHSAMEVIIPIENYYEVVTLQNRYYLNVGDILFIPPGKMHELISPSSGARFIYLFSLDQISSTSEFTYFSPLLMNPFVITQTTHPDIYQSVYQIFMQMNEHYFQNIGFRELSIYSLIFQLFVCIGKDYYNPNKNQPHLNASKQKEYHKKFGEILLYLDANYMEDISLEIVAAQSGFSKFHFSRLFKQYTNSTFYDYLCHKRVQVAQSHLSTPSMSITDIAFKTGFGNLSTFCRTFKKYTDCSPSDYRKTFLKMNQEPQSME